MFTYRIEVAPGMMTVAADDSWVLDPAPGVADRSPDRALLTVTTSRGVLHPGMRTVGVGVRIDTKEKSDEH